MAGGCDLPHTCLAVEPLLSPVLFGALGTSGGHYVERQRRN